jgi:hypothetical protein
VAVKVAHNEDIDVVPVLQSDPLMGTPDCIQPLC